MFDENRFFDSIDNHLIAWVGSLNEEGLRAYLDEKGSSGTNAPQSLFAVDLGRAYDHDLLTGQASPSAATIESLARLNSLDDSQLVHELSKRATAIPHVSCFLVLWNAKRVDPQDRWFADGRLICVGSWRHASPFNGW